MLDSRRRCVKKSSRSLALHSPSLATRDDRAWIDGLVVFLHFDHLAFLVDQISDAARRLVGRVIDAIFLARVAAEITQ